MFIDTRKMGTMTDRRQRELTEEELNQIVDTYHNWRIKTASTNMKMFLYEKVDQELKAAK